MMISFLYSITSRLQKEVNLSLLHFLPHSLYRCVKFGNLDPITPTIPKFFPLCYAGVNLTFFLLDLLDAPNWRPPWKIHQRSLSLLGASICIGMPQFYSGAYWLFKSIQFDYWRRGQ
ncbi:hypothetical protein BT93_D0944 [Corymbia citriodora subsp. variegata]|nr:hypothetical protein BT93_D0944 [Corymbia citriodora subsp. variegata]